MISSNCSGVLISTGRALLTSSKVKKPVPLPLAMRDWICWTSLMLLMDFLQGFLQGAEVFHIRVGIARVLAQGCRKR